MLGMKHMSTPGAFAADSFEQYMWAQKNGDHLRGRSKQWQEMTP